MMVKYGLMEPSENTCLMQQCNGHLYNTVTSTAEEQALAKELATKAVLLLKNVGVLPLSKTAKIALLGSACDAKVDIMKTAQQWDLGSYYFIGGSGRVIAKHPVTIFAGLQEKCDQYGCEIATDFTDDVNSSISVGQNADVVLVCGGSWSTEGYDRPTLSVEQEQFIVDVTAGLSAVSAVPKVSVTLTPGTIVLPWVDDVNGVLNLFLGGQYTGNAIADVVFGDFNPSGKTPVTFPKSEEGTIKPCPRKFEGDVEVLHPCEYTEGLMVNHQLTDEQILFPFGHGLSYTTFVYSSLIILPCPNSSPNSMDVCITARVQNIGNRA